MGFILNFILSAIAVFIAAYIVPGVNIDSFGTALIVALVLGLLNAFVKPILNLLTLPINIMTLGLFSIVINILILYIASALVAGFSITSLLSAILFGLILAVIGLVLPTPGKAL